MRRFIDIKPYVPPALTFWNSVLCPQCTFMFSFILAINSDYLLQQIDCVSVTETHFVYCAVGSEFLNR